MRRVSGIALGILLTAGIYSFALAEEPKGSMTGKEVMGEKSMMMNCGKMMGMCPMRKMMKKEMVAAEDGGVIIMAGNKILKYDKDLNLKKEAEIKMDMECVQKTMKNMTEKCSKRMKTADQKESTE